MIQKPKGTLDLYGSEGKSYEYIRNYISSFMMSYNYEFIKIPTFEASELFIRSVGETTDIVNKETYNFVDKGSRNMTLRPEFTAGVVRMLLENKLYVKETNKFYYFGSAYRYERPQSGRLREFTQFGVEAFGVKNAYQDAEVISIAYRLLNDLGLNSLKVKINSLGDTLSRENYKTAISKYLKDKINNLCEDCKKRYDSNILRILDCKIDKDNEIILNMPKINDYLTLESKNYFNEIKKALDVLDIPYEEDSNLVRGLDYYTDIVFEIISEGKTLGTANTVCGGGRYDDLVMNLGGKNIPAVGFALGIERLMILLKEEEKLNFENSIDAYIMNLDEDAYAYELVDLLRSNGFIIETSYLNKNMKSQFKIVEEINPKFIIIVGSEEAKGGYATIKDNVTKENIKLEYDKIVEYLSLNV